MAKKKKVEGKTHEVTIKNYFIKVLEQDDTFMAVPVGTTSLDPVVSDSLDGVVALLSDRMAFVPEAPDPSKKAVYRGPIFRVMADGSTFVDLGRVRAKLRTTTRKDTEAWTEFWELGQDACCAAYPGEESDPVENYIERVSDVTVKLALEKIRVLDESGGVLADAEFTASAKVVVDIDASPTYTIIQEVITQACPTKVASHKGNKALYEEFQGACVADSDLWDAVDPNQGTTLGFVASLTERGNYDNRVKWFGVEVAAIKVLTSNGYDPEEIDVGWPNDRIVREAFADKSRWEHSKVVLDKLYSFL